MKITARFKTREDAVQFATAYLKTAAENLPLILTIRRTPPEGYYVDYVTEDSSSTSPPTGSEPQPSTLKTRPLREGAAGIVGID